MLQMKAAQLRDVARAVFVAAGAPEDIAAHVAGSLVESNLMGHDSHGVIRVPKYVEQIQTGVLVPAARATIVKETLTTAVVSGNWGFAQVAAKAATEVAIRKAKEANMAGVGVVLEGGAMRWAAASVVAPMAAAGTEMVWYERAPDGTGRSREAPLHHQSEHQVCGDGRQLLGNKRNRPKAY